jgi:hypothetical protein
VDGHRDRQPMGVTRLKVRRCLSRVDVLAAVRSVDQPIAHTAGSLR